MNKKEFVGNKTSQPESIAASLSRVVDIFLLQFALKSLQNQRKNYEPLDVDATQTIRGILGSHFGDRVSICDSLCPIGKISY